MLLLIMSTLFSTMWSQAPVEAAVTEPETAAVETMVAAETDTDLALTLPEGGRGLDYDQMVYTDYDDGPFYAAVEQLYTLADAGDADGLLALYDQLYDQLAYLYAMEEIAYNNYCEDVYDDTWADTYQALITQITQCADALCVAENYVTQSACAQALADHVGQAVFDEFAEYEPITDRELELVDQETQLVNDYYRVLDQVETEGCTYNYQGRDWDWEMFWGYQGDALASSDYDAYLAVYYGICQAEAELVAPIYAQLVAIRQEIATLEGYDSYNDYAYEQTYGRDYTPEDAQLLCDAVKPIAQVYYDELYYADMAFAYDEVQPSMDTQTLLDTLAQYVAEVDPSLAEPLEFMTEHGLYSFGSGDGRVDGAYTVEINYYQSPYIYMYLDGSIYDFLTLSHEFGHYCNAYFCPETDLLGSSSFDLMEIHSNGLQALMTQWYDQIFTQGADVAEFINLAQMMENIIDGCIQDEFQRRIYDSQEELTAETINRIYTEVFSEYISYEPNQWNNTWLYIPHNFESPLYYISYAASAVAALQIWDLAQTDPQAAADTYMSVLTTDAGENSYTQVLTNNGLRLFSEDGAVSDICQPVLDRMFQLAQNY